MMNAKYLNISGCKVRYIDNEATGPVLFLTHGIGGSLELWEELIAKSGKSFRMIAWDIPGHGLSDFLDDKDYSISLFAEYAWQLLDHLKVNTASLMGNSLGGAISIAMLKQQALRVDKLVLLSSGMLGNEVPFAFRLMRLPVLGELMTKSVDTAYQQQVKAIFAKSYVLTDKVKEVIQRNVVRAGAQAAFLANVRAIGRQAKSLVDESCQILTTTTKPILFIHGREDSVIPVRHSENAHAFTTGSKLILIDDCGHTPQLEKPDQVMNAVDTFFFA